MIMEEMSAFYSSVSGWEIVSSSSSSSSSSLSAGLGASGSGSHVVYVIETKRQGQRWTVFQRYSRFAELHSKIKTAYAGTTYANQLPKLPSAGGMSSLFKNELDPKFIEERRQQLDQYLQEILDIPGIDRVHPLWLFLTNSMDAPASAPAAKQSKGAVADVPVFQRSRTSQVAFEEEEEENSRLRQQQMMAAMETREKGGNRSAREQRLAAELATELATAAELQQKLNQNLLSQQDNLDTIESNTTHTTMSLEDAITETSQASKISAKKHTMVGLVTGTSIGGLVGVAGGPVGVVAGAAAGSALGAATGKFINYLINVGLEAEQEAIDAKVEKLRAMQKEERRERSKDLLSAPAGGRASEEARKTSMNAKDWQDWKEALIAAEQVTSAIDEGSMIMATQDEQLNVASDELDIQPELLEAQRRILRGRTLGGSIANAFTRPVYKRKLAASARSKDEATKGPDGTSSKAGSKIDDSLRFDDDADMLEVETPVDEILSATRHMHRSVTAQQRALDSQNSLLDSMGSQADGSRARIKQQTRKMDELM